MKFILNESGISITFESTLIGNDLNVCIYGGDKPHIGAVALATPYFNEKNNNISASTSVITIRSHKEDEIVKMVADNLSRRLNKVVVVCAGIHINEIKRSDFIAIDTIIKTGIEKIALSTTK